MATIRHIAIFSDDPSKLAKFYVDVYGMKITGESQGDVWITDGYMDVALIMRKTETSPKPGIHHFGFTLAPEEKEGVYDKMKKLNLAPWDPRAENPTIVRPFVEDAGRDPDGNRFDLSTGKREMEAEKLKHLQPETAES
jgi:catechol 2,3-dioxygenase-like lactoylglutathione lyase family enzyme